MKVLIPILIGLLVVGCGKNEVAINPEDYTLPEATTAQPTGGVTAKPVKGLTIKDIAGNYELKLEGGTAEMVILENGKIEFYENGKKNQEESRLKMAGNEIHFDSESGDVRVFRSEPNGDLTYIAEIEHGKRHDHTKERQATFKKIK